ncbi:fatty acid desaturase-domain-containing protein [Schizophyllum amplum]|uniref:Fatty acid desaturase-domain-containing protein n=1 Tax=Schizophyllum amplum TaxID=97359 RepID=A0A550CYL1_9AGAR|nr:fatty acid desaturase-domain-containing protein [Auriculariopsis ampla]
MFSLHFWKDGPEYEARLRKPFTPPKATLKDIHDAVPKELLRRNPWKGALYVLRDVALALVLLSLASRIKPWADGNFGGYVYARLAKRVLQSALWASYWWFQGLTWAGIFCLGHDAGHGTLFHGKTLNNCVGFMLHSFLLAPYFSWRATHHAHHKATGSMERDENYVPYERSDYPLPPPSKATRADYAEIFEETPIFTLGRMLLMQGCGWWVYLAKNTLGSKMYPPGTNHFDPKSPLFKPEQRAGVVWSNLGIGAMLGVLCCAGWSRVSWYYVIPYLLSNHWIVMFTYLHHSDPTIPHYRKEEWSFFRGAAATVDRPLMGWMGRFFLHNISHDHVAHHFFIQAPFYNGPEITKAVKSILKDDYNYDSTPSFYALYRSFTQCQFVEDEGGIVFYKDREGKAAREVAEVTDEVKARDELSKEVSAQCSQEASCVRSYD